MQRITCSFVSALAAVALITGCDRTADQPSSSPAAAASSRSADLPANLFLATAPSEAVGVKQAKAEHKQGDSVVVRGRIGGSVEPFVVNRAVFTLMDASMPACSDNPDDACTTPWDYCCESREDIVAHAATIQVVDASGQPMKVNIKDAHGLKPLSEVVVVGTLAQRDDAGTFTINATGLYVAAGD